MGFNLLGNISYNCSHKAEQASIHVTKIYSGAEKVLIMEYADFPKVVKKSLPPLHRKSFRKQCVIFRTFQNNSRFRQQQC